MNESLLHPNAIDALNMIPERYRPNVILFLVCLPYLTRYFHALANGRGLKGAFASVLFGTNTPKPTADVQVEDVRQTKLPLSLLLCLGTVAVLLSTGCGHVNTFQRETVTAPDGTVTVRETKFKAGTFFDSKNDLAKAHTTMTDKTQGVTIAGLEQESSGSNVVALTESVVKAAVSAAVKSVVPVP